MVEKPEPDAVMVMVVVMLARILDVCMYVCMYVGRETKGLGKLRSGGIVNFAGGGYVRRVFSH
jgi:hypothetical protein